MPPQEIQPISSRAKKDNGKERKLGAYASFPNFPTFLPRLETRAANLLGQLSTWVILQNRAQLLDGIGV